MTHQPSAGVDPDGDRIDGWPASIAGVTETIVATKGPNGRWNQAALGIAPAGTDEDAVEQGSSVAVAAHTYGRTRTRRNLAAGREAIVQFTRDPLDFVEAALGVFETDRPVLSSADAWTRVSSTDTGSTRDHDTEVVEWSLEPVESSVRERTVPTTNRGRAAVIEATVPASRLGIEGYDDRDLLQRLSMLAEVVQRAGDERSTAAFDRIDEHVGWKERLE
ncbi:hypothetical protein GCM10028857_08130 [Salinarchaeum chitinilyticum]